MAAMGAGSSGSITQAGSQAREQVGSQTRDKRTSYIRDDKGNVIGNNYVVPGGDFGRFLGYKPPTAQEMQGKVQMSSKRTIEVALQKEMASLGEGAAERGNSYRNIHIAWGRYAGEPGRERDSIKDALDSIGQGPEKNSVESRGLKAHGGDVAYLEEKKQVGSVTGGSPGGVERGMKPGATASQWLDKMQTVQKQSHNDNVRLLEMQYRFLEMSKNDTVISNLMKVRNDAVTRSIRGGQ